MFCTYCGKELPAGSRFCGNCGKPVATVGVPVPAPVTSPVIQETGTLLTQLKSVSKYKGTPTAGYSDATGTLMVYNDRLEFQKKGGSALWARGGAIGLGISAALAKSSPVEVFELDEIGELREGKYMGVYNTLVVSLKNGDVWSFCPALPGSSEPKKLISLLIPYLK